MQNNSFSSDSFSKECVENFGEFREIKKSQLSL
jgi:hypothetical protein